MGDGNDRCGPCRHLTNKRTSTRSQVFSYVFLARQMQGTPFRLRLEKGTCTDTEIETDTETDTEIEAQTETETENAVSRFAPLIPCERGACVTVRERASIHHCSSTYTPS